MFYHLFIILYEFIPQFGVFFMLFCFAWATAELVQTHRRDGLERPPGGRTLTAVILRALFLFDCLIP